jgi:dGTPase
MYLLISANYRRTFEESVRRERSEHTYWKLRLLTDEVSGMTDTYACRLHSELTNGQDRR